jgi:ABC-type uncharacterized transport system substrate-binding protein
VRGPADFDAAFVTATEARVDALYIVSSRLTLQNLGRIVNFAAENRLPLAGGFGAWAKQHGLLSYGPNIDDMTRRAVAYIDRILKGTKPADLPIQQPTRFELVINLRTAKVLGLNVPLQLQQLADEVSNENALQCTSRLVALSIDFRRSLSDVRNCGAKQTYC